MTDTMTFAAGMLASWEMDEWSRRKNMFDNIDWFLDKMTKGQPPNRGQLRGAIREFLPGNWQGYNGALLVTIESIARMYEHERGVTLEVGDTQA